MSIRIALDDQPEFYTNLDSIDGRIILSLSRPESVGGIIVKLEGESKTALAIPGGFDDYGTPQPPRLPGSGPPGNVLSENHKILYKVQQVFPTYEDDVANGSVGGNFVLPSGQHEFPFKFKLPLNNACSDPVAMSKIGGLGGLGGFGAGGGIFGIGGMRVMDGSKQLFMPHVTKTLPPSFTGMPMAAEVRYYVKVTIQRPGLLKENWRYQIGFKFMPIEPPRPPRTTQEAFARRPFTFKPRISTPAVAPPLQKKRSSFFMTAKDKEREKEKEKEEASSKAFAEAAPPSIELSARLPHPPILTCNQPVPLRLIAKKLVPSNEQVYLTSLQIELVGTMTLRAHDLNYKHPSRWTIVHQVNLNTPLLQNPATDEVGVESVVPDDVWRHVPLPNTVAPSFATCNLQRTYELELKVGLSWGAPTRSGGLLARKEPPPQTIYLPLTFAKVQVYSNIAPPPGLLQSLQEQQNKPAAATLSRPPRLPPRTNTAGMASSASTHTMAHPHQAPPQPQHDPLYPPQLSNDGAPPADDAPPSYDEAMADTAGAPFEGTAQARPAFSGVTNENAPSDVPTKS
ncbi:hypothetical protein VD0004_g6125 [Verticillium dahliae]|nr:hypothetical protein VD0004_g6125 [Verticillium dahliae]PNH72610.1 hypothetical protein VD0001_g4935 [Verticillium dahliae]